MLIVNLDMRFYPRVEPIRWLAHCGESSRPEFGLPLQWVEDRTIALQSMLSTQWAGANTRAQGRLTGYLAKTDYDAYGSQWGKLFEQSWSLLEKSIGPRVLGALEEGGWPASLARTPLPEITPEVRASIGKQMADHIAAKAWSQYLSTWILGHANSAALEVTYRRKFPKAPIFFERLLEVYEAGRFPCGWDGDVDDWPNGKLVVF